MTSMCEISKLQSACSDGDFEKVTRWLSEVDQYKSVDTLPSSES